jgi:hypothetical protein
MPFYQYKRYIQMLAAMMRKEIPLRPESVGREEFSDQFWNLLTRCWNYIPKDRPTCKMLQASITELGIRDDRSRAAEVKDDFTFGEIMREESNARLDYKRLWEILSCANTSVVSPSPTGKSIDI